MTPCAAIDERRCPFWIAALLATAVLAVYAQVWHHEFLYFDDGIDVSANPYVHQGVTAESLAWALTSLEHANWQPLTRLSHLLVSEIWGLSAPAGLAVNVGLHMLNTVLLFATVRLLTGATWASAALAALWALHPLRVESVAWLTERKDVLSGMFWILSLACHARYARRPGRWRYGATLACYALGLMAKPMVITLPCVLLLIDFWPLNRWPRQRLVRLMAEKIPFLVLAAGSAMVTMAAHLRSDVLLAAPAVPLPDRLAIAAIGYLSYLAQTFWPARLAAFYSVPPRLPADTVALAVAVLAGATLLAVAGRRRGYPLVGWLWFLGTLVPVIGLVKWGHHLHADRFTYLPAMGLTLVVVWAVADAAQHWPRLRPALSAALALAVVATGTLSWHQAATWKDFNTLFSHAVQVQPGNWWALTALAGAHAAEGRHRQAIPLLREALAVNPDFPTAQLMLGRSLAAIGATQAAQAHFERAIALAPQMVPAHVARAELLAAQKQWLAAEKALRAALAVEPASAAALFALGTLELRRGRPGPAERFLRRSLAADPAASGVYNNLAVALAAQGRADEARRILSLGRQRFPTDAELLANQRRLAISDRSGK